MENQKIWWKSKSIWGGLLALIAGLGGYVADVPYTELLAIAGSILAIYGRFTAVEQVVVIKTEE